MLGFSAYPAFYNREIKFKGKTIYNRRKMWDNKPSIQEIMDYIKLEVANGEITTDTLTDEEYSDITAGRNPQKIMIIKIVKLNN